MYAAFTDAGAESRIQDHRLARISRRLQLAECAAIALFDPVNIRYATGTRNMQVWSMHNICRYAVVFADGPAVLFEQPSSAHLARDRVDDIRPSLSTDYMAVGDRGAEMGGRWAQSMISLLRER
ncbi:MAG: aminopeptidase P family protein, partial [Gammaproteobacteria bacterium]